MCPITITGVAAASAATAGGGFTVAGPVAAATATTAATTGFVAVLSSVVLPLACGVAGGYGVYKTITWLTASDEAAVVGSTATSAPTIVTQAKTVAEVVHKQASASMGSTATPAVNKGRALRFRDELSNISRADEATLVDKATLGDKWVLDQLKSEKCPEFPKSREEAEEFVKEVKDLMNSLPSAAEKMWLHGVLEHCLDLANTNNDPINEYLRKLLEGVALAIGGVLTIKGKELITNQVQHWIDGSKDQSKRDDYLLDCIDKNLCNDIHDVNTFEKEVRAAFSRNPTRRLTLETKFQNCLDESIKKKQQRVNA